MSEVVQTEIEIEKNKATVIRVSITDKITLFFEEGVFFLEIDDEEDDDVEFIFVDDDMDYANLPEDDIKKAIATVKEYLEGTEVKDE